MVTGSHVVLAGMRAQVQLLERAFPSDDQGAHEQGLNAFRKARDGQKNPRRRFAALIPDEYFRRCQFDKRDKLTA